MGISQSLIGKWEQADDVQVSTLVRLEEALELDPGYLFRSAGLVADKFSLRFVIESDPGLDPASVEVLLDSYAAARKRTAHRRNEKESE